MNKLFVSMLAAAALAAGGSAFAQDAESQAGSAWRNHPLHPQVPVPPYSTADPSRGIGPAPGTPEYYGNSGWMPPSGAVYQGVDQWGRPLYSAAPAAPYQRYEQERHFRRDRDRGDRRARGRDRDGDGVRNHRDRFPDDGRRW